MRATGSIGRTLTYRIGTKTGWETGSGANLEGWTKGKTETDAEAESTLD